MEIDHVPSLLSSNLPKAPSTTQNIKVLTWLTVWHERHYLVISFPATLSFIHPAAATTTSLHHPQCTKEILTLPVFRFSQTSALPPACPASLTFGCSMTSSTPHPLTHPDIFDLFYLHSRYFTYVVCSL